MIIPNKFVDYQEVNESFFDIVDLNIAPIAENYMDKKKVGFIKARKNRYRQLCWWQLTFLRKKIRNHGGIDLDGK